MSYNIIIPIIKKKIISKKKIQQSVSLNKLELYELFKYKHFTIFLISKLLF